MNDTFLDRYNNGQEELVWRELQQLGTLTRGGYNDGQEELVWPELQQLGPPSRQQYIWRDAYATARATMQRVRKNIEVIYTRLNAMGYRFLRPKYAFLRPAPDTSQVLEAIESDIGPLPLSLRAFYEVVGEVDFRQSEEQLVQWMHPRRDDASEIELLGEEDPLVVAPLEALELQVKELR